jgi:hypothetical protein
MYDGDDNDSDRPQSRASQYSNHTSENGNGYYDQHSDPRRSEHGNGSAGGGHKSSKSRGTKTAHESNSRTASDDMW